MSWNNLGKKPLQKEGLTPLLEAMQELTEAAKRCEKLLAEKKAIMEKLRGVGKQ